MVKIRRKIFSKKNIRLFEIEKLILRKKK